VKDYWTINHDLHFLIAGLIGNAALRDIWDQLYFQAARMWYVIAEHDGPGVATSLTDELREMRKCLADGDMAAAGFIQRNYIAAGARRIAQFYG
jgi:DNA-binding GntR family transcriptional regulator